MSDIKLFQLGQGEVTELVSKSAKFEKDLQQLVEPHMEVFLGIRFLATEFTTSNGGRIDSLGLDENGCPVIIEYKRHINENVINQGLFYYDWLLDHKAEFQLLVTKELGQSIAENIEWEGARLVCIATDFTRYDEHAIKQIDRNIELMRYKYFGDNLFLLELVNSHLSNKAATPKRQEVELSEADTNPTKKERRDYHENRKSSASSELLSLYESVCDFGLSLGDDVQRKELKFYTALKKIKNFASVQVWAPQQDPSLRIYLHIDPSNVQLQDGVVHDAKDKGHWGTGDLEVIVRSEQDLELAKQLVQLSFEKN
ncbi:hypothetical protein PSECIP111854_02574 [Pseudoalteromonas sp. CIP111854]|uniref:DUF91 domain-containing protein n=1 Tax=Pseudoalteromonas holothuriae TaxID=2963714 RepID=A0A9W4QZK7_9GAMM|nr:DUF5655 domain-containing protein [Pseudoalteromonas sp. CIP111854]CAH9060281.1 hypothetical protein PSECIP111854_02574 [Pseudoalteromonas sp. CIP111854]